MSRLAHSSEKPPNQSKHARTSRSDLLGAMLSATDSGGHLTILSLANVLRGMGISEPTAERLIGQAEMEGVLIRSGKETWIWLQQSS